MRRTLGVAVFSGMVGVTLFGIFLTPVFYYALGWLAARRRPRALPVQPDVPRPQDPLPGEANGVPEGRVPGGTARQ